MPAENTFKSAFNAAPAAHSFTPGRVNLIGEHTDYNGGHVLPAALHIGIHAAMTPRADNRVRVTSDRFTGLSERDLSQSAANHWSDYALGAAIFANKAGYLSGGADIAMTGNLPTGAGLSSSSALTVGLLKLAAELSGKQIDNIDVSRLARRIENEFIGMPCGIMDQMAVAVARPGQALSLDTKHLTYDLVDLPADYHFAVLHSGQYRRNADGHYKIRKEECDAVKAALGHYDPCLMSDADLAGLSHLDDNLIRRARHCMTEHRRTLRAAQALKDGDITMLGRLMNESHVSMRDDFEMSLPPIDALVADAVKLGAAGARLTGGGFGGCIVACVKKTDIDDWTQALLARHPEAFAVC